MTALNTINQYKEVSILLVDDDDVDAKAVQRSLKKLKIANPYYRVRNGKEAVDFLKGENGMTSLDKPYIILLDLNMPDMGGIEFLEVIRDDPIVKDAIVFVLTTSSSDEDRIAAYKKNIAGYIVKSGIDDSFLKVIDMIEHYWRVVTLPV